MGERGSWLKNQPPEVRQKIASRGGKAAHVPRGDGTIPAYKWTPEKAQEAGRLGGEKVSENKDHMRKIGRKGGENSRGGGRRRRSLGKAYIEED